MTHVTCPYCGRWMSSYRLTTHRPICPLRPDIWQRLLLMWAQHGYVPRDMHDILRDSDLPSSQSIIRTFGGWMAYVDHVIDEVDIEIPDTMRNRLIHRFGSGKYGPVTACDCGHAATVVVWLYVRGGYHPVRQEMPLCSDCFDLWQEDEDPNGWGVVRWL